MATAVEKWVSVMNRSQLFWRRKKIEIVARNGKVEVLHDLLTGHTYTTDKEEVKIKEESEVIEKCEN